LFGFLWFINNGAFHSFPYLHIIAVKEEFRNLGIIIASVLSSRESIIMSIVMSMLLIGSVVMSRVMVGEWYLATIEMVIVGLFQLSMSLYMHYKQRTLV
jgi:hypothetical protein